MITAIIYIYLKYLLGTVDIISNKEHAEMKRMLRNMVIMQSHYILDLFHNHAYHITMGVNT